MKRFLHLTFALMLLSLVCALPMNAEYRRSPNSGEKESVQGGYMNPLSRYLQSQPHRFMQTEKNGLVQDYGEFYLRVNPRTSTASMPVNLSPEAPRGTLFGLVTSYNQMVSFDQAFWGQIDPVSGDITRLFASEQLINGNDYDLQGGVVIDDVLYTTKVIDDAVEQTSYVGWSRVDVNTGEVLTPVNFGSNYNGCAYSMTYDPNTKIVHFLSFNQSTGSFVPAYCQLSLDEIKNGGYASALYICDLPSSPFIAALCYNPLDQQVYAFDDNNNIYILDTYSGELYLTGTIEMDISVFTNLTSGQVVYSPKDRSFLIYYRNMEERQMQLLYLDPETYEYYLGPRVGHYTDSTANNITSPFVSVLHCPDPFAEDNAPEQPERPEIKFIKANTTGTITVKAPEYNYAGLKYTGATMRCVVKVNGEEVFNEQLAPGASKAFGLQKPAGVYNLSYICYATSGEASPETSFDFCIGHDTPLPPADLKVDGYNLTWSAPTASKYNGYVDYAAITYDVYFGEEKLNAEPIAETSYVIPEPSDLRLRNVRVTASANGKTSDAATLNSIIGPALTVPVSLTPSAEEAATFTVVNTDQDALKFVYNDVNATPFFELTSGQVAWDQDDWLFLPKTLFDDNKQVYNIGFNFRFPSAYGYAQDCDIVLATEPSPRAVVQTINSYKGLSSPLRFTNYNTNFYVETPGEYYVGIHMKTKDGAGGILLNSFTIQAVGSSAAPGIPTVEFTADSQGDLYANAAIIAPSKAVDGTDLDPEEDIQILIWALDNTADVNTVTTKPGTELTKRVEVLDDGTHTFAVQAVSAKGEGLTRYYTLFVGQDKPATPENLSYIESDDNMTAILDWDPVGSVGANGGYVDPAKVTYHIYYVTGVAYYKVGETKNTHYEYTPAESDPRRYTLGVVAVNDMGQSPYGKFQAKTIGTPNEIPMIEYFITTGFNYPSQWIYVQENGGYVQWDNAKSISGDDYANPRFNGGCMYCWNTTEQDNALGSLLFPKFSTRGSQKICVQVDYWDYQWAPEFFISARSTHNHEFEKVQTVTPARNVYGEMVTENIYLPEKYWDENWVELKISVQFGGANEFASTQFAFFDRFQVAQEADYDLKVAEVTGPSEVVAGNYAEYGVKVLNGGLETVSGRLTLNLLDEAGNVLDMRRKTFQRLKPSRSTEALYSFYIDPRYVADNSKLTVQALVEAAEPDEIPSNNERTLQVELFKSILPAITDLRASWNDDQSAVNLTWSDADLYYGDREDCETFEPFSTAENLGLWKNIDMDKALNFGIEGLSYPNMTGPAGWYVMNAEQLGVMNDDRLCPHSGKQYLMAFALQYDEDGDIDDVPQANDWLISPEIVGGSDISFWYGTPSTDYTEYVELWYSSTDRDIECFSKVRTFSKSGSAAWEKVTYTLPDDAKYFALVYRSFNCFAAMLDDIQIVPKQLELGILDHYSVWRYEEGNSSDIHSVCDNVQTTNYTDVAPHNATDAKSAYRVYAYVNRDGRIYPGPASNDAEIWQSGIDDVTNLSGIYGGKGCITITGQAGQQLALYDTAGRIQSLTRLASDNATISVAPGIYVAKVGNAYAKVVVR